MIFINEIIKSLGTFKCDILNVRVNGPYEIKKSQLCSSTQSKVYAEHQSKSLFKLLTTKTL